MAHLRNYATLPECEVAALAEPRKRTAELVAARYGIDSVYDDHKQMIDNEKLDGIVAVQPFERHAELLPELYDAVGFIFTEKPLALSVDAGKRLLDAAEKKGCIHMVGYHKRSDPAVAYAKRLIEEWRGSGEAGPLKYVRITMPEGDWIQQGLTGLLDAGDEVPQGIPLEGLPSDMDEETGRRYRSFVNYYIHQVNLMRYLMGEPYRVTYGESSGVVMAVESASGIAGIIEMNPYRTTVEWEESVLVAFEKAYIKIELCAPLAVNRTGRVEVYLDRDGEGDPYRKIPSLPWIDAMRQQAVNFVRVCRGEMDPPCDAREALEDLRVSRNYVTARYRS